MSIQRFLQSVLSLNSHSSRETKLAGLVAIVLALLIWSPFEKVKSHDRLNLEGRGLEGSWINYVSPILPPGVPPVTFQTYVTLSGGGGWIGSDRNRPFASPQHGTWVHLQGDEYQWTLVQDLFDQAGVFQGTFKARSRVRLVGKNEYVGVASVEQRDPNGSLLLARCARQRGVRIVVEPFAPPCVGLESSPF